jgi:hypothetical protein
MERKVPDFSVEKHKRNRKIETKLKFCKPEIKTKTFVAEMKTETEQHF